MQSPACSIKPNTNAFCLFICIIHIVTKNDRKPLLMGNDYRQSIVS